MEEDNRYEKKVLQPKIIIKCPHCGYEYLPGEIFYPDNAIGQPKDIIRDPLGKIIYNDYRENQEPLAEEEFYCDGCGKAFVATIELKCDSRTQEEALDFSDTTASLW